MKSTDRGIPENSTVHEDYLTKAIGKESVNYIGRTGLKWMCLSMVAFYMAHYYKIDAKVCELCGYLSNKIAFVEKFANVSSFPDGMRMQWLFLTITSPCFFYLLLKNVKKIKYGDMKFRIMGLSIITMAGFLFGFILANPVKQEKGLGIFTEILRDHFFGSPIASFLIYCVFTSSVFFTFIYIKAYLEHLMEK